MIKIQNIVILLDFTNVYSEGDFQHVQIDDIMLDHKGQCQQNVSYLEVGVKT